MCVFVGSAFQVYWPSRSAKQAYFGADGTFSHTINYNKSIYCHIMWVYLCTHTNSTHTHRAHTYTKRESHSHLLAVNVRITNYMTLIVSFTSVFLQAAKGSILPFLTWLTTGWVVWLNLFDWRTGRLTDTVTNWLTGMTRQLLYALSEAPQPPTQNWLLSQYFRCCPRLCPSSIIDAGWRRRSRFLFLIVVVVAQPFIIFSRFA